MKTLGDIATHFRRRCIERLGHPISYDRLLMMMRQQRLQFVRRQSLTRTIWRLPEKVLAEIGIERADCDVTIVYDKMRHGFVTVMVSDRKTIYDKIEMRERLGSCRRKKSCQSG